MSLLKLLTPLAGLGLRTSAVCGSSGHSGVTTTLAAAATTTTNTPFFVPVRHNHWPDWRMKKDNRRRQTVITYSGERDRLNTIKKNNILPIEIRELAVAEIRNEAKLPRDSNRIRLVRRCAITSRPKGCVSRWRLSRIMFRLFADYNKMSGVQRALW